MTSERFLRELDAVLKKRREILNRAWRLPLNWFLILTVPLWGGFVLAYMFLVDPNCKHVRAGRCGIFEGPST